MCGNGIRCLIAFLNDNKEIKNMSIIPIETKAGLISTSINGKECIKVNMGEPILSPPKIPTKLLMNNLSVPNGVITINDQKLTIYAASMGNPHMIVLVTDIEDIPFEEWGRNLEKHSLFPNDTNVHFVELIDKSNKALINAIKEGNTSFALKMINSENLTEKRLRQMCSSDGATPLMGIFRVLLQN